MVLVCCPISMLADVLPIHELLANPVLHLILQPARCLAEVHGGWKFVAGNHGVNRRLTHGDTINYLTQPQQAQRLLDAAIEGIAFYSDLVGWTVFKVGESRDDSPVKL